MFQSQEAFALLVLALIIIVDAVVVVVVLIAGSQHDHHHISPTGTSAAVTKLHEVYNFPEASASQEAALPAQTATSAASAETNPESA
jgi:hypothetical protein